MLIQYPTYDTHRNVLCNQAKNSNGQIPIVNMSDEQKYVFILSNTDIAQLTAKTSYNIVQIRFDTLYK